MKRFPVASLLVAAALLVAGAPVLEAKPQHAAPPSGSQHAPRPGGNGQHPSRPAQPSRPSGHNGQYHPSHGQRPPAPHYAHGHGYRPGCPPYPYYRHYPYHYYPYGYYPSSSVYLSFTSTTPAVRSIPVTRDLIASVQDTLNERGYNAGPVDGIIGGRTQSAIADYQADRGLRQTGVIDAALLRSLGLL